jgi:hypothetical protein
VDLDCSNEDEWKVGISVVKNLVMSNNLQEQKEQVGCEVEIEID